MKIFYTKQFKEVIGKPYRKIELGKYKLQRGRRLDNGNEYPFSKLTTENILDNLLTNASPSISVNGEERFYEAQFVRYGDRLQISLDIPKEDQSIYVKSTIQEASGEFTHSYYQVFLFYFTEDEKTELAFIVFNDFRTITVNEEERGYFRGLNLTSRRNIITTPPLDIKCDIDLFQSRTTSFLEDEWGGPAMENVGAYVQGTENYISNDSWKAYWIEEVSGEGDLDWTETVFINNFGLKIY